MHALQMCGAYESGDIGMALKTESVVQFLGKVGFSDLVLWKPVRVFVGI